MFNLQFGDFYGSHPNWFDWLNFLGTIFVSVLSIFIAFYLGERNYKRDKKERVEREKELMISENNLFRENLRELKKQISIQEDYFKEYLEKKEFKQLVVNPSIQVSFLKNIDVKQLYKKVENDKNKVEQINTLFSYLYGISNFENSIQDEYRTFIRRYNELETIFKDNYGIVFYDLYFEAANIRGIKFLLEGKTKKWSYDPNDSFMERYSGFVMAFLEENKNGAVERK